MPKAKSYVPEGMSPCIPSLVVRDASALISFLEKALGAQTVMITPGPNGKGVMHGHLKIGEATLFVGDENPMMKAITSNIFLYVRDVDAAWKQAITAGGKPMVPPSDQFWGDRWCAFQDTHGNVWQLATRVEDVPPEEMGKRAEVAMKAGRKS